MDTIRILVATDNHLGVWEKDRLRKNDSFETFEEILQYAHDLEVDLILLGGDLYHDNKPSQGTFYRSFQLFRKYCLGSKACQLEFLGDPEQVFPCQFGTVNYEDPNYNISIPVFIIHGNHDDPSGEDALCALDMLAVNGLVNYFGKSEHVDKINVTPVLLRKGSTQLAIYGIGNIRDERLYQTFTSDGVSWLQPEDQPESFFNLMVIHQNRVERSSKSFIPESFLPDLLDFVIWGHEHDSLIDPWHNSSKDFEVVQPGSSVVCSLTEGETVKKHVALMEITGREYKWTKIPLKSNRSFIMKDLDLETLSCKSSKNQLAHFKSVVEKMIVEGESDWELRNGYNVRNPRPSNVAVPLPLVRLRVSYPAETSELVSVNQIGADFKERVANPRDILHFVKKRTCRKKSLVESKNSSSQPLDAQGELADTDGLDMDEIILNYLTQRKLSLFAEEDLTNAISTFVDKSERDCINEQVEYGQEEIVLTLVLRFVKGCLNNTCKALGQKQIAANAVNIQEEVKKEKEVRCMMLDAMKAENSQSPTKGMRRVRRDQLEGVDLQFETKEEKEARKTRVTAGKAAPAIRKVAARQTKVQKENLENDDNFNTMDIVKKEEVIQDLFAEVEEIDSDVIEEIPASPHPPPRVRKAPAKTAAPKKPTTARKPAASTSSSSGQSSKRSTKTPGTTLKSRKQLKLNFSVSQN